MPEAQDAGLVIEHAERAAIAGDLVSADELLRSAARIQEAELGPLHPDLASTLNNLGIVAEKAGRPDDAEAFFRRSAAIASASLPSTHPLVADSRKNLEDFCRERGLPVDAAGVTTAAAQPAPLPLHGQSRSLAWVAIGAVLLVIAALFVTRASAPRETPTPSPTAARAAQQAADPPQPPAVTRTPIEQAPPRGAPTDSRRRAVNDKRPAVARAAMAVSLTDAQLCQTFSTSGRNWRCDPVGDSASRAPIVLYTRVRSARDTVVVHRWFHGNTLRQSVKRATGASPADGYRTYSRFAVDRLGDWRVEVKTVDGGLLFEKRFTVR